MAEVLAGRTSDFDDGGRAVIDVQGRPVVVLRHGDTYYALDNTCRHMGGPLGDGMVIPRVEAVLTEDRCFVGHRFSEDAVHIVCPWHGYEYDISSGRMAGDETVRVRTYRTDQRGEDVYVLA